MIYFVIFDVFISYWISFINRKKTFCWSKIIAIKHAPDIIHARVCNFCTQAELTDVFLFVIFRNLKSRHLLCFNFDLQHPKKKRFEFHHPPIPTMLTNTKLWYHTICIPLKRFSCCCVPFQCQRPRGCNNSISAIVGPDITYWLGSMFASKP